MLSPSTQSELDVTMATAPVSLEWTQQQPAPSSTTFKGDHHHHRSSPTTSSFSSHPPQETDEEVRGDDDDGVGYQFVPVLTPTSDTSFHSRHRQSPPIVDPNAFRDLTTSPITKTAASRNDDDDESSMGHEDLGTVVDEDEGDNHHDESSIHRPHDMDISSAVPTTNHAAAAATTPISMMLGQHLLNCLHNTTSAGQNISALVLSSCGLHDEDIALSLCAPNVLPHLFTLDLSDNLLQTFPTFVLRRMTGSSGSTAHPSSGIATTKPTSPWVWNVSRNHRMRLFPPMVLECEVMGSIVLTGCLQLMPNVVVAGLKGLVCGEVYLPDHTDETAVFENMLGLLAVNGRHVHKRGPQGGATKGPSGVLGPQHARKCEGHLQNLRRRYLPASPTTTPFVALLLDAVRLQVEIRHVDHPRLLQRHLKLVEQAQESYVMQQLSAVHRLWASATDKFDAPPPPVYSIDDDGDDIPNDINLQFGVAPLPPPTTLNIVAQRPLSFPVWKRLLFFADGSDGQHLPFFDAAVCAMVGCSVFPDVFPRCLVLQFVDRILEECLTQQAAEVKRGGTTDTTAMGLHNDLLNLCGTVGWWPVLIFDAFYLYVFGAAAAAHATDSSATAALSPRVMQSHHTGGSLAGHWSTRRLLSPLDLPLERLLMAAQALGIGAAGNSQPRHHHVVSYSDEEEIVVTGALQHFAEMLTNFHGMQETSQTAAAIAAESERRVLDTSEQVKHNRVRMLSRPTTSSMASLPKSFISDQMQQESNSTQHQTKSSIVSSLSTVTTNSRNNNNNSSTANISAVELSLVEQESLPIVHNGFLPMRVPSTSVGGTEISAPVVGLMHSTQQHGGGGAGAFRLVDPRATESPSTASTAVQLAQRHHHVKSSSQHLAKSGPSPIRIRDQHASFDCLRPNTPAATLSSLPVTSNTSAIVTGTGSKGIPRASSAGGQYMGHLEARLIHAQQEHQRPPSSAIDEGVGVSHVPPSTSHHHRRSRTLLDFLNKKGVLRLQSASAMRAIDKASTLDFSDLRQVDDPPTLSEGDRVADIHDSRPSSSSSSSVLKPTVSHGRAASGKSGGVGIHHHTAVVRVPSSATTPPPHAMQPTSSPLQDPSSVGCTLEEYYRAERLYNATASTSMTTQQVPSSPPPPSHTTLLQALLGMIYKLLEGSRRQPGEVLRVFTAVVCEHALNEVVRMTTEPPTWCEWICADLQGRGALRQDYTWVVDDVHMASAFQLGKKSSTSSPSGRNLQHPLEFSSEIVETRLAPPSTPAAAAPLAFIEGPATRGGASREDRRHIPTGRPASRLNAFARNDSALDRDLVALSKAVAQPTAFVIAQPKSIRAAPPLPATASSTKSTTTQAAAATAAAPQHLVDRGAHPFTVQAQQVLERERLRSHIRAASAEPEDPYMSNAIKRSCSASLRPIRQPPQVASGRESTDWVATNTQFLPTVVRDHVTGTRKPRR